MIEKKKIKNIQLLLPQLILDILPPPFYAQGRFIKSVSNCEAFSAIESWPKWPSSILSLYGPKGCGKTYLSHIWKTSSKASFLTLNGCYTLLETSLRETTPPFSCFILEDLVLCAQDEKILFDLYNFIYEKKSFLLITSSLPLTQEVYVLKDLQSRLKSLWTIEIKHPDESLLLELMYRYFDDVHLYVEENLLKYALLRLERSFEHILLFCEYLNKISLAQHQKITRSLMKKVLDILESS